MVYSELERKIRHRKAVKRNRKKNDRAIKAGNKKAIRQREKDKY